MHVLLIGESAEGTRGYFVARGHDVVEPAGLASGGRVDLVVAATTEVAEIHALGDRYPDASLLVVVPRDVAVQPLLDAGAADVLRLPADAEDITARVHAAEQRVLHRSERLSQMLAASPVVTFMFEPRTSRMAYVSDGVRQLGYRPADFQAGVEFWRARVHPDDLAGHLRAVGQVLETGGRHQASYRFLTGDGTYRWLREELHVLRDGERSSVVGAWVDVTESRRQEDELRLLQRTLSQIGHEWRAILDRLEIGVLVVDEHRRIVRLNEKARELFGEQYGALIGSPLESYLAWEPWASVSRLARSVVETDRRAEVEVKSPDGEQVWEIAADACTLPGAGKPYAIVTIRDTTEDVRLRRAAEETARMAEMGALVAGVAHEVRNPLFGISSIVDALDARLRHNTDYIPHLDILRDVVGRLGRVMRDLLDLGASTTLDPSMCPPGDLVRDAAAANAALAAERGVTLERDVPDGVPAVWADRARMVQVLQNLIDNAIRFSPPGARVVIRVSHRPSEPLRFEVRDHGPGFGADRHRAFDAFMTRRKGGTGLGLAIVRKIMAQHKGTAEASDARDGGAVVTVSLPVEAVR